MGVFRNIELRMLISSKNWELLTTNMRDKDSNILYRYLLKNASKINSEDFKKYTEYLDAKHLKMIFSEIEKFYRYIDFSIVFSDGDIISRLHHKDKMRCIKRFINYDNDSFKGTVAIYKQIENSEMKNQIIEHVKKVVSDNSISAFYLAESQINSNIEILPFKYLENIVLEGNNAEVIYCFGRFANSDKAKFRDKLFKLKDLDSNMKYFLNFIVDEYANILSHADLFSYFTQIYNAYENREEAIEFLIKAYDTIIDLSIKKPNSEAFDIIKANKINSQLETPIPTANNAFYNDENRFMSSTSIKNNTSYKINY